MVGHAPEIRARLAVFRIDESDLGRIRAYAGVVDAETAAAAEEYCRSIAERSPEFRAFVELYCNELVRAETGHFRKLFAADFGLSYLASIEATGQVELRARLGARAR